jgi:hypothetical protein
MPGEGPEAGFRWCSLENTTEQLIKHPGKSLALVSCVESVCPYWQDGRCGHLITAGRHGLR